MWPIVPIFTCGLLRSNFSFAIRKNASLSGCLALNLADDFFGERAGDLEGHFRGIDIVVAAVIERDLHVGHGIARQNSTLERFLDTGFRGVDIFLGNSAA